MDSFISHLLVCTEMSSTFYDVLKVKKVIKFKKYFEQQFCVACFETLFFSPVRKPLPLNISPPCEVVCKPRADNREGYGIWPYWVLVSLYDLKGQSHAT